MYKVILKFKAINGLLQAQWTDHRLPNWNLYFTEKCLIWWTKNMATESIFKVFTEYVAYVTNKNQEFISRLMIIVPNNICSIQHHLKCT